MKAHFSNAKLCQAAHYVIMKHRHNKEFLEKWEKNKDFVEKICEAIQPEIWKNKEVNLENVWKIIEDKTYEYVGVKLDNEDRGHLLQTVRQELKRRKMKFIG